MKNTYLFILAAFLFVAGCKKDDAQQQQQPATECPANNTFVKDISQYVGSADILSIQEASDGSIHVEVYENGIWKVHGFSSEGVFMTSIDLGTYDYSKALKVRDAYYITDFTESYTTPSPSDTDSIFFQGWVQVSGYVYSSSNNVCHPAVAYDIWAYNETFSPTHSASTGVQKISFTGTNLWTNTFDGYYSNYLSKSPIVFDENGNLFLLTVDYKGAKMKARINNNDYEFDDPNRPAFYLNDSVLMKDEIHSYIVTRVNSSNGTQLWQKRNFFDQYYDSYVNHVNGIVTSSNIWVCNSEGIYKLDLSGNLIEKVPLFHGYCVGKGYNKVLRQFSNGDLFVSGGDYSNGTGQNTDYRIDVNGNIIWEKSINSYPSFANLNFTSDNGYLYFNSMFDNNGNLIRTIPLVDLITATGANFNCTNCGFTRNNVSCNDDLLFVRSNAYNGNGNKTYLIRTNSNGDL